MMSPASPPPDAGASGERPSLIIAPNRAPPAYPPLSTFSTGLACKCPRCGKGDLLQGFLTIRAACPACGLDYGFADPADGPAFFGMSAVGVVGMGLFMWFEFGVHPPIWVHMVVTMPLLFVACLAVLRPLKGWMVSEQFVHKAAPPEWESVGKHGEGSRWR
ncbi:DUF983 domain-containing protein [Brevundimonas sp.]|jgi:uncharacterized protein (DUF983 family)|uniref:DUF983 domain-containing protein n=1 Tax=Brevundimonas sp. TaxID=1871086 RepID=UPI0035623918